jgi:hypothetical protein
MKKVSTVSRYLLELMFAVFGLKELIRVARLSAGLDMLKPRSWSALMRFGFGALRPQRSDDAPETDSTGHDLTASNE